MTTSIMKVISLVLCAVLCLSFIPISHAEAYDVTRVQWIQELVNTFDMTVEGNNYPDNYYTDISADDAFYRDIMVAVEFGVIHLDAGEAFRPNDAATRDFAAETLVFCLGFQPDEDVVYTFKDTVPHPFEAQLGRIADGSHLLMAHFSRTERSL